MALLSFSQYQARAASTAFYPHVNEGGHPTALAYCVLKLNGESGEVAEILGKTWRQEGGMERLTRSQRLAMLDECGDVLWYIAQICSENGTRMETVANWNLYKLQMRAALGAAGWDEDIKDELMMKFWDDIKVGKLVPGGTAADEMVEHQHQEDPEQ